MKHDEDGDGDVLVRMQEATMNELMAGARLSRSTTSAAVPEQTTTIDSLQSPWLK